MMLEYSEKENNALSRPMWIYFFFDETNKNQTLSADISFLLNALICK